MRTHVLHLALLFATVGSAGAQQHPPPPAIQPTSILAEIADRVRDGLRGYPVDSTRIPRSLEPDGSLRAVPPSDWTSGFFAGVLWQLADVTGDERLRLAARDWTMVLENESAIARDHDAGFRIYNSYGQGWRITGDSLYLAGVLRAAGALASRYSVNVGAIQSWNPTWGGWTYPVIVDNMMNLELLFGATRLTGDSTYYRIALQHASTTLRDHYREDGSSYHVVDYDSSTGAIIRKKTVQGAFDESVWARGQSWGLYGFTMTFRETGDTLFLDHARKIASFLLDHPNLPADGVPYWDYNAPGIPATDRDVSAGAIMASALIELAGYAGDEEANRYREAAERILGSLWRNYRAADDVWPFALGHSVGNHNIPDEVGVPIIYADYYFVEALRRRSGLD
jgi:hypothetical protein